MPCSASAGRSSRSTQRVWRSLELDDALADARRAPAAGVRPSAPRSLRPASTWSCSPATRIMKNSSRFDVKIAANFTRSSSGTFGVLGELQHAVVEVQPGELAVEVERGVLEVDGRARQRRRLLGRQRDGADRVLGRLLGHVGSTIEGTALTFAPCESGVIVGRSLQRVLQARAESVALEARPELEEALEQQPAPRRQEGEDRVQPAADAGSRRRPPRAAARGPRPRAPRARARRARRRAAPARSARARAGSSRRSRGSRRAGPAGPWCACRRSRRRGRSTVAPISRM